MPYDSRVYRVLIASPSDVHDERELAVRLIQEWNDLHSYSRKPVLLPLRWETHTAPEYGTRPQEAINRAIVDDCDLLVGLFWTRIGSSSGEAESGTLEEIERVATAGKPVMLYFSQAGIDPYLIDAVQHDRLRQFRASIFGMALIESYKSLIEFRDKFSRQLEITVREMQTSDSSAQPPPLALQLLSIKERRLCASTSYVAEKLKITDIDEALPDSNASSMRGIANNIVTQRLAVPLVLVISNQSDLALYNLFIEVMVRPSSPLQEMIDKLNRRETEWTYYISDALKRVDLRMASHHPRLTAAAVNPLSGLESMLDQWRERDSLEESDGVWRFSMKWDSLQPQRQRLLEPVPYAVPLGDVKIQVEVRVFADSLPKPLTLSASLDVAVQFKEISAREIIKETAANVENAAQISAAAKKARSARSRQNRAKRSRVAMKPTS